MKGKEGKFSKLLFYFTVFLAVLRSHEIVAHSTILKDSTMLSIWKSIFQKNFIISLKYFSSGNYNFLNLYHPELEQSPRGTNGRLPNYPFFVGTKENENFVLLRQAV